MTDRPRYRPVATVPRVKPDEWQPDERISGSFSEIRRAKAERAKRERKM